MPIQIDKPPPFPHHYWLAPKQQDIATLNIALRMHI